MGNFICANPECNKKFQSNHSVAKYCSHRCSGIMSARKRNPDNYIRFIQKYTDEELLEILRAKAKELGRRPSRRDMIRPDPTIYHERFGGWTKALHMAGLVVNEPSALASGERAPKHKYDFIPVPAKLRFQVFTRDKFRCIYCGGSSEQGNVLEIDHLIPRSKGGTDDLDNLVTACSTCNQGKGNQEVSHPHPNMRR